MFSAILTVTFTFLIILLMEIVLSVDNAAVLGVVVNKNLQNQEDRNKALKYGIIGAYVFRGLSLGLVSWILYNPEVGALFKVVGGLYLCYLWYTHSTPEADSTEEGNTTWIENLVNKLPFKLSKFWITVIMVEFVDIVFSLDNLVACVALSDNIWIVVAAVFVGILGMRFVAQKFSTVLEKYPQLESAAFFVILLLGIKMTLGGVFDWFPETLAHGVLNSHITDFVFSLITLGVFAYPVLRAKASERSNKTQTQYESINSN